MSVEHGSQRRSIACMKTARRGVPTLLAFLFTPIAFGCTTDPVPRHQPPHSLMTLSQAVQGSWRSAESKARDRYRHPLETLEFFCVNSGKAVVEITPGYGWYTEIIAPLLASDGRYIAALNEPDTSSPIPSPWLDAFREKVKADESLYGRTVVTTFNFGKPVLGESNSADVVLTFRNVHNWILTGNEQEMFHAFFDVLKPGGVLGVVEHRAKDEADPAAAAQRGYVPQAHVITLAVRAGFVLDGVSEVNANKKDTKDYPHGVWSLPPTLVGGAKDRAKYLEIGESDRMTLRFMKPLKR